MRKLSGGVTVVLLCVCIFFISACQEKSEQQITYEQAESILKNISHNDQFKEAALLFESLGEYEDAVKQGKWCWSAYASGRMNSHPANLRFLFSKHFFFVDLRQMPGRNDLEQTLPAMQDAKKAFERAGETRRVAETEATIRYVEAWIAVLTASDDGNDEKAMDLLAAMGSRDKSAQALLRLIQTKGARQEGVTRLREYLKGVPQSTFEPDEMLLLQENLQKLWQTDAFNSLEKEADSLVSMRCYDIIAHGWNNQVNYKRKLSIAEPPIRMQPSPDLLLLATIKLAESGDESAEFSEILALLRGLAITPSSNTSFPNWKDNPLTRYASLLELYSGRSEWVEKCFPTRQVRDSDSMEYRVLHAPQRIKDALYDEKTDLPQGRFTRLYTMQEAKELFADFTPQRPQNTGYILILDKGTPPPTRSSNTTGGQIFPQSTDYESDSGSNLVRYEWKDGPTPLKDGEIWGRDGDAYYRAQPMIEEHVRAKGKFFCAANPDNARIAIYETYSFKFHGKYKISGKPDTVDVYMPVLDIKVVDLLTGKTLFTDTIHNSAQQSYNTFANARQGDTFVPQLRFNRRGYLEKKLDGILFP